LRHSTVYQLVLVALLAVIAAASNLSKRPTCSSSSGVDVQDEPQQALLQLKSNARSEQQRQATLEDCVPACRPYCSGSARPGKPCVPPVAGGWPYTTNTEWRTELGERMYNAVTADVQEKDCGGFHLFGDHVFCLNAMKETNAVAFSYGIEQRDLWSEILSNKFHVTTRLYDCFQDPDDSAPVGKTAPNGVGAGACTDDATACYETPYESNRICLGASAASIDGRVYETLESHLAYTGPLGAYVKMDVEGSEWGVLENLLKNEELQNKIRTLDMEVHFGQTGEADGDFSEQGLRREVEIFEQLTKVFHLTGSSLEVAREGWKGCEHSECLEPTLHMANGFPVTQLAVSFVNRKLLP